MDNLSPEWRKFQIRSDLLCDNNPKQKFNVRCYDWEQDSECMLIGEANITVEELKQGKKQFALKKNCQSNGVLRIDFFAC